MRAGKGVLHHAMFGLPWPPVDRMARAKDHYARLSKRRSDVRGARIVTYEQARSGQKREQLP